MTSRFEIRTVSFTSLGASAADYLNERLHETGLKS